MIVFIAPLLQLLYIKSIFTICPNKNLLKHIIQSNKKSMQPQETDTGNEIFFIQQANNFHLEVTLSDNKLTITLKDYLDWLIYSKEFTEDDIGKDIYKKMDLTDVYCSFSQTQPQITDEKNILEQKQKRRLRKYQFGQIIKRDQIPCYSIQRGGKIVTYQTLVDKMSKKELIYESRLKLNQVRALNEMEIFTEKSGQQKRQIFQQLSKKIQKQSEKIEQLEQTVASLKQKQYYQKFMVTLTQQYPTNFTFLFPNVKYSSNVGNWVSYFFNDPITTKGIFKFKITSTQSRQIMLGVADYFKQRSQANSYTSGNAMCYYGANGAKYPSSATQGTGFKTGDIVEIDVNRTTKTIKYIVNGKLQATDANNMLEDRSRIFVPFAEFNTVNDSIDWIVD